MLRYVIKRVALAVVTVFIVITLTFFLMNAVPGGPFMKEKALSANVQAELEARYHLDKPVPVQFGYYLKNLAQGDFGVSLKTGRNIATTIQNGFAVSLRIGSYAALVAVASGLVLGTIAALKRNTWVDRIIVFLTTLLVSVPSFVLATLLMLVFCLRLQWVPVWTANNPSIILPVIALALYPMAYITRLTKSSMLDVLGQDYIRTAQAKGVGTVSLIGKHALKNGLLPVVTYFGPMFSGIITGSLVVENVFTIGGLGSEFVKAINNRDYPLIMGITIFLAVLLVAMNLLSDLLYKVFDPRINFD